MSLLSFQRVPNFARKATAGLGVGLLLLAVMTAIDYEFGISVFAVDDYKSGTLGVVIAMLQMVIVSLLALLVVLESD